MNFAAVVCTIKEWTVALQLGSDNGRSAFFILTLRVLVPEKPSSLLAAMTPGWGSDIRQTSHVIFDSHRAIEWGNVKWQFNLLPHRSEWSGSEWLLQPGWGWNDILRRGGVAADYSVTALLCDSNTFINNLFVCTTRRKGIIPLRSRSVLITPESASPPSKQSDVRSLRLTPRLTEGSADQR